MGGGKFSHETYTSSVSHRSLTSTPTFEYSAKATENTPVHPDLDTKRIHGKPFKKLESRDSFEHPESNAVVVCLDVTGSNIARANDAQKKLPKLMEKLEKYLPHPQVAIAANDDYHFVGDKAVQFADFESDNRVDEHLRDILLTSKGGGNNGESYDLAMYIAANLTILDCKEKRGRKGYFFMYADEPIFMTTSAAHLRGVLGKDMDVPHQSIPIQETIAKLKELYHVYVIWPMGGYIEAYDQYKTLFGKESVVTLQHPNMIVEAICGIVGMNEGTLNTQQSVIADLTSEDVSAAEAAALASSLFGNRPINVSA